MTTDEQPTDEQPTEPGAIAADPIDPDEAAEPMDAKAKFRAALERKNNRHHAGAAGIAGGQKSAGSHGAAGGQRMFRRKSG